MPSKSESLTCNHDGCAHRRWRNYPRCETHQREYWVTQTKKSRPSWKSVPPLIPRDQPVRVLALDYQTNQMIVIEGRIVSEEGMPKTELDLLKRLAEAGRDGVLVAKPQPYKAEDL